MAPIDTFVGEATTVVPPGPYTSNVTDVLGSIRVLVSEFLKLEEAFLFKSKYAAAAAAANAGIAIIKSILCCNMSHITFYAKNIKVLRV